MSVVLPMGNTWTRKSKVLFWLSFAGYGASWSEEFLARGWPQPFGNAQMLNLRSLAAILYSAIRFSRAAFLRSPLRSKALINTQKMATNMPANIATKMVTNRAASISVSYQQSTPETWTGKLRRYPAQKHNQRTK